MIFPFLKPALNIVHISLLKDWLALIDHTTFGAFLTLQRSSISLLLQQERALNVSPVSGSNWSLIIKSYTPSPTPFVSIAISVHFIE